MEAPSGLNQAELDQLATLLRRRLAIIADHGWRDADPDAHLEALKAVSLEIGSAHQRLTGQIPQRLQHFLSQCSFDKALAFLEGDTASH